MRLSSRLFCLVILTLLSISATAHAGTMAITAVGPSSYIRPSIENNYVHYRYQITNELGQDLYLSSVAAGSGDLKNVSIDDGSCSFYDKDGDKTTPLTPGASCDVFVQAPLPTLATGVTRQTASNTITVKNQLGYSASSQGFSVTTVQPSAPHQQILYQSNGNPSYQHCLLNPQTANWQCKLTGQYFKHPYGLALSPDGKYLYATHDKGAGDGVDVCDVNTNGTLGNCRVSGSAGFSSAGPIVLNSGGTKAYVGDIHTHNVHVCDVDKATGGLSACQATGSGFDNPYGLTLSPNGQHLYASHNKGTGDGVDVCDVNTNGTLGNCRVSGSAGFSDADSIILNSAGTKAYVGDYYQSKVFLCDVDKATGGLSACQATGSGFYNPYGLTLSPNGQHLYATHDKGTGDGADVCDVNTNGTLDNCKPSGSTGFDDAESIILNSDGTKAYVGDVNTHNVHVCDVDKATGGLSACQATGSGFFYPYGLALSPDGKHLYATHDKGTGDGVDVCDVNTNGTLGNCRVSGSAGFSDAESIILNSAGTKAYVGDITTNNVHVCDVNKTTGGLTACDDLRTQGAVAGYTPGWLSLLTTYE